MVGLYQIKQEVRDKIALVRYYIETGKETLNKFSLHALLTGNPGTGRQHWRDCWARSISTRPA
jgi:hypothetical protein